MGYGWLHTKGWARTENFAHIYSEALGRSVFEQGGTNVYTSFSIQ